MMILLLLKMSICDTAVRWRPAPPWQRCSPSWVSRDRFNTKLIIFDQRSSFLIDNSSPEAHVAFKCPPPSTTIKAHWVHVLWAVLTISSWTFYWKCRENGESPLKNDDFVAHTLQDFLSVRLMNQKVDRWSIENNHDSSVGYVHHSNRKWRFFDRKWRFFDRKWRFFDRKWWFCGWWAVVFNRVRFSATDAPRSTYCKLQYKCNMPCNVLIENAEQMENCPWKMVISD